MCQKVVQPRRIRRPVGVASEPAQNNPSSSPNLGPLGSGHRRSRSEVVSSVHNNRRNVGFQKWKSHVQRALRWGNNAQKEIQGSDFNPEILADQKGQWYQLHSKTMDQTTYKETTSLFEHFIIVSLHPYSNLEAVEDAYARQKKWELQTEKSEGTDNTVMQHLGPSLPKLEPQILFKYPLWKRLAMRPSDLAAFCFPEGVEAWVLERTPSLSELNELVYGQEHLSRDDLSFVYSLKVADNATLYGVCLRVQEFVQRPPGILGPSSPLSQSSGRCSRFLVYAPRCYCVLTRVPFFKLHYEILNSIVAQERLNRITQFVSELSLADYVPSATKVNGQMNENVDSPDKECCTDLMATAIPVDSAVALAAVAAGIKSDDKVCSSSSRWEPQSPGSTSSEVSDHSQAREIVKNSRKISHCLDDHTSDASENPVDGFERSYGSCASDQTTEIRTCACPRSRTLERLRSSESLFSSVGSFGSEDEDDEIYFNHEKVVRDEMIMEWAKENDNALLQIVCSYHAMHLPQRGGEIAFKPLEHLQSVEYRRSSVFSLAQTEKYLNLNIPDSLAAAEVNMKLAAVEEAVELSIWTTATICQILSLENILTLLTGVLLEIQVIVVCPNLGALSAIVLSLIPMIRPFEWHSLFLPVLPGKMLDFLDAPVPFLVGIQNKPADIKTKMSNFVHVQVAKDQDLPVVFHDLLVFCHAVMLCKFEVALSEILKLLGNKFNKVTTCKLPTLPQYKELICELGPIHARLSCENTIATKRPVYKCNEVQADAAAQFLTVMRRYLESLCAELRCHTITSVKSNNDRVSLLLKDSFVDSFPSRDQSFVKLFVDTQLFTVLSDSRLSSYENGYR